MNGLNSGSTFIQADLANAGSTAGKAARPASVSYTHLAVYKRQGHGILYTFEEYIAAHLASGQLQPILHDWWQHFEGPYLYYHSRRNVPAPLRAFVDYVKALNNADHSSQSPK